MKTIVLVFIAAALIETCSVLERAEKKMDRPPCADTTEAKRP